MKIRQVIIALLVLCCGACDNSTDSLGIYTDSDNINASSSIYEAHTRSIVADSVLSNSNSSYLGQVTDKETGLKVKAEFLAQFSTLEDYNLPAYDLIAKDENGNVVADSIEIRLYYEKYYGKNNIPMKLSVYELDTTNVIREDSVYYSNADLKKYINKKADGPLVQKVFTARDFTVSDDVWNSGDYAPNIRIVLLRRHSSQFFIHLHSGCKYLHIFLGYVSYKLCKIQLVRMLFRRNQLMGKHSVIGKKQKTFRILIQSPHRKQISPLPVL